MDIIQMGMEMGAGSLMGALMAAEMAAVESRKVGVPNIKSPSIVITQKDSLSEHTVGVEKK